MIIPNHKFFSENVINWSHNEDQTRFSIQVGVAYGSDTDKVSELLLNIAKEQQMVLDDPEPSVLFMSHGESSLDFELRVFLPTPMIRMDTLDAINKDINRKLAENGIQIPFPQRDIHIKRVKTT
jgi:small-conductance mechanosensitive channel